MWWTNLQTALNPETFPVFSFLLTGKTLLLHEWMIANNNELTGTFRWTQLHCNITFIQECQSLVWFHRNVFMYLFSRSTNTVSGDTTMTHALALRRGAKDLRDLLPIETNGTHWLQAAWTSCSQNTQSVWPLLMCSHQPLFLYRPLPNSCPVFITHPQVTPLVITQSETSLCPLSFKRTRCLCHSLSFSVPPFTIHVGIYFHSFLLVCKLLECQAKSYTLRTPRAFNTLFSVQQHTNKYLRNGIQFNKF